MFEKNHQRLIDNCYPPKSKDSALPNAVSNAVSTLTFYSAGRPKKLPKVSEALLQRAQAASGHGSRGLANLAVTVDVMKALVTESRQELGCFAAEALEVAALGLKQHASVDLFARAASLFHGVLTFSAGSSLAINDSTGHQYIAALTILTDTATKPNGDTKLKWIALHALDGVARSEWLYATEYQRQLTKLGPAFLSNCLGVPTDDLLNNFTFADAQSAPTMQHPTPLANRKSPSISPPAESPAPIDLATLAVGSLRTVSSRSHGGQLLIKLNVYAAWLNKHDGGQTWSNTKFIEWMGTSSVSATAVHYRAAVVSWWAEQTGQIPPDQQPPSPKSTALLSTLSAILRSTTNLVGLGVGSVLSQLSSLLVKREGLTPADPLSPAILSAIAALGSHIYYFDQINDIVSDLIEALRAVGRGAGAAVNFDGEQRARVMRSLVGAIVLVLEEARQISGETDALSPTSSPSNGGAERPPLPEDPGTVRGNGVLVNGGAQGLRSKKESASGPTSQNGGKRSRVSPEVFQESLFLLTDIDPVLRSDYARALISYVLHEMSFATEAPPSNEPTMDPSQEVSRFLHELHASAYELATSSNLGASKIGGEVSPHTPHSGASTPGAASPVKIQLQTELQASRRGSVVDADPVAATPADYIILSELLEAIQSKGSALGLLTGLPMLLALYQDAPKWEVETPVDQADVRIRACRVVAAGGIASASSTWKVIEVHQVAEEAKAAVAEEPRGASLPSGAVINGFAACMALQAASGLDQLSLASSLGTPWSRDGRSRTRSLRNPYLHLSPQGETRSVSNVSSTLRLATPSDPHGSRTFRAPSLADLQSSLGASSTRTSAAPSIASTSGTTNTYATSRRTARGAAKSVLERLERMGVSPSPSASQSRLSVSIDPPYLGVATAGER